MTDKGYIKALENMVVDFREVGDFEHNFAAKKIEEALQMLKEYMQKKKR